jgi:lipopolysaccharide export system permease protein
MRTSGVSFYRIMVAPLVFGVLTSLVSFAINEAIVPPANRTSKKLEFLALYKSELPAGQANFTYMERGKDLRLNRVFYIGYYNGRVIQNVIILDFTRDKLVQIICAASGIWDRGQWVLSQGRNYALSGDSDITRILQFKTLVIPGIKNAQKALVSSEISPKEMNMFELARYVDILKESNAVTNDLLVRLYQKITQPLACLIVALAGAPLGLLARRSRSNIGLIYSAVVVFLYYVLQSSSGALGEAGRISPLLAAWLPNIVIGALGFGILYFKAK